MNIGFIGNFEAPFSTENDRKWSFRMLGHNVVTFQENKTSPQNLMDYVDKLDLLVYSHTHGWEIPSLEDVFKSFKEKKYLLSLFILIDGLGLRERLMSVKKLPGKLTICLWLMLPLKLLNFMKRLV